MPARCALIVTLLAVAAAPATAQTAGRADDLEVRTQMEQVRRVLDRFIDGADSHLRPPSLANLRAAAARMISTYRPPAATAVPSVAGFLKQAKAVEEELKAGPGGLDAAWADVVPWIVELGQSYQVDWRAEPSGWTPRRITDQEVRLSVSSLSAAADDLAAMIQAVLKTDKIMDPVEKKRAIRQVRALASAASDALHRVNGYEEIGAIVPRLVKAEADLKPFISTYPGAGLVQAQWQSALKALETVTQAYGARM